MKTETRKLAEAIQKITGETLLKINLDAQAFLDMGLPGIETREQALRYMLELESQ